MSTFIAVKNGIPEGQPFGIDHLKMLYPEISFPVPTTPEDLKDLECGLYEATPSPIAGRYEKVIPGPVTLGTDSVWHQTWEVIEMTPEEKLIVDEQEASRVRGQVQSKLQASDWTQLPDVPLTTEKKTEWAIYRTELRNVSEQQGFPWTINWPIAPSP